MSPGILTIAGNLQFNFTYEFEVSATPSGSNYNDLIRAGGTISLENGAVINIVRWGPAQPSFGQRFTILQAKYNTTPSDSYILNFPDNTYTLTNSDTDGRYLLVTPADTGTNDGFPHTSNEYAVYFVRGAQDYVFPGVSPTITEWVQTNTLVGPGGLLEALGSSMYTGQQYINPIAARLMVMNDEDLYAAMLLLTEQERQGILLSLMSLPQCNVPPYNATNFTPSNISIFSNLVKYAGTQPQYPLNTGSNASQIYNSKANISYFNSLNQQTLGVKTANGSTGQQPYPVFRSDKERLMYIQGMSLTSARNKITGNNPSAPMGVPCSTIYQIINS
jgi:hypothetical protein